MPRILIVDGIPHWDGTHIAKMIVDFIAALNTYPVITPMEQKSMFQIDMEWQYKMQQVDHSFKWLPNRTPHLKPKTKFTMIKANHRNRHHLFGK